jgi:hypothetical protein
MQRFADARVLSGGCVDHLAYSVRLAKNIRLTEAKTSKDPTIQKRTEPAFIEPMPQEGRLDLNLGKRPLDLSSGWCRLQENKPPDDGKRT